MIIILRQSLQGIIYSNKVTPPPQRNLINIKIITIVKIVLYYILLKANYMNSLLKPEDEVLLREIQKTIATD